MKQGTSLIDRQAAIAEELLFGAVDKAMRGERWDWISGLSGLGLVPTSVATGKPYRGRWNKLFLRLAQAWGGKPAWDKDGPDKPYLSTEDLSKEIPSIAKQAVAASMAGVALISDDA